MKRCRTREIRFGLPSLGYEIRGAETLVFPAYRVGTSGGYGVFVSEMTLGLQLLHEGDLFALLDLLDERAQRPLYRLKLRFDAQFCGTHE